VDWLRQDLRLAVRSIARRPGFSALAILTLALGLGVNTVAFSAVNALLFKPFRQATAGAGGWLFVGTDQAPLASSSLPAFEAIAREARTLELVAAEGRLPLAFAEYGSGATSQVWSLVVSPDYFSIIAVRPLAGRTIRAGDDGRSGLGVVVSQRFWERRLGLAPDDPLGRASFTLNNQAAYVIGVLPDGFQGPGGLFEPDLWVPLEARRVFGLPPAYESAEARWLTLVARPRPDVTREAVETEISNLAAAGTLGVETADRTRVAYERFADGHPEVRALSPLATLGLGIVGVVLLIACLNVAGLVLARSMERRRDLSVRAALGAGRWRLARQMLTEGLVVAAAAGLAALLLASWSAPMLSAFSLPAPIPQRLHFATDWRLVGFAAALAVVAAVVPALAPIWQVARTDLARWIRVAGTTDTGAFSQRRTRRAFVLAQIAGSTFFLGLSLVFVMSFLRSWQTDPGFDTEHTALVTIDPASHGDEPDTARAVVGRIVEEMRAAPGVAAVTVADRIPFYVGFARPIDISLDGGDCDAGRCVPAASYAIGADYFDTLGIRLTAGRGLNPSDPSDLDAVVVSATAAAELWPNESAIGQSLKTQPDGRWRRVVGVAADVMHRAFDEAPRPHLYVPLGDDDYAGPLTLVARSSGDPAALVVQWREAVRAADPRVPPQLAQTMADRLALPLWAPRTAAGFFGICGLLAVVLSATGLFGVTYVAVSQRRREFGVRFALGAEPRDVRALVMRETLRLAAPGVAAGAAAAVVAGVAVASRVTGVGTFGPVALSLAVVLQVGVVLLAGWAPARRASASSPLEVLRAE